jgi:serine/threonine-protein kinase
MSEKIVINVSKGRTVGGGERFEYTRGGVILVGRDDDCAIRFDDLGVSRRHCRITVTPSHVTVCDLDSTNGTFLNGEDIRCDDPSAPERELRSYDRLGLGKHCEITIGIISKEKSIRKEKCKCSICGSEMKSNDSIVNFCAACRKNKKDTVRIIRKLEAMFKTIEAGLPHELIAPEYRKIRFIKEGGMGKVYLTEKVGSSRTKAAVKLMKFKPDSREDNKLMFQREMSLMQQLKHPNLVKLYKCGQQQYDNKFFIAMEYCAGGNVEELVGNHADGRLDLPLATAILLQALDGLDYIHNVEVDVATRDRSIERATGVVHRDIKPSNILLLNKNIMRPVVRIADLGIAKAFATAGRTIETRDYNGTGKIVRGTFSFMSHMQYLDCKYVKPDTDVWAMSATYYYMLTGRPVRNSDENTGWTSEMYGTAIVPIRSYRPEIPEKLAKVIGEALIDDHRNIGILQMVERYDPELVDKHKEAFVLKKMVWESLSPEQQQEVWTLLPAFTKKTITKG